MIEIERYQTFENGDIKGHVLEVKQRILCREPNKKKLRAPDQKELIAIRDAVYGLTPDIAYFPTFIFDFPEKISLGGKNDNVTNLFYRKIFQDILDFDGKGHTIEGSIIGRIRNDQLTTPWAAFLSLFNAHDDRNKIQQVMDRAGSALTRIIFGRWNAIFKEDVTGREIVVSFEPKEGEEIDARGNFSKSNKHDVIIRFQVRDGTRRFAINDRSLGFRWFFLFMLFTQFRTSRTGALPVVFLLDEPASNLHAAAQQKLLDSFPEISKDGHLLFYSTHSHYLIEPKWLEQTFIVTNRADNPSAILDTLSLDDESLDIQATPYSAFVDTHPNKTSYFQPILDRLNVVPSRFDINRSSVIVEGKSDYYVLRYAASLFGLDLPLVPALGAGTFASLVALHLGWNLKALFILDGDRQGKFEKKRYIDEFGLQADRIYLLSEIDPTLTVIEDLIDLDAETSIRLAMQLHSKPTKNQIRRFFQEHIASGKPIHLSAAFEDRTKAILQFVASKLV